MERKKIMTWRLTCLNMSAATLNATFQFLVIYRFVMPAHNEQLLANVSILLISYCLGRRFNIGTIKGIDVIYVMTGEQQ